MAADRVRTAELVGALCLATDLGSGVPFGQGLASTLVGMRIAERMRVDHETALETYYGCLLFDAGCTADAREQSELFADIADPMSDHVGAFMFGSRVEQLAGVFRAIGAGSGGPVRRSLRAAGKFPFSRTVYHEHMAALCEITEMFADAVALPGELSRNFRFLTDRWDGEGPLGRARTAGLPMSIRIVQVARDACFQRMLTDSSGAVDVVRGRAGGAFDPAVVDAVSADLLDSRADWSTVLDADPEPQRVIESDQMDDALNALAAFADLADVAGHSRAVADLAARAAQIEHWSDGQVRLVRRAALVHDLGKVGVPFRIWKSEGTADADAWEKARLHPYFTERILAWSPYLSELATVAGGHHEHLDGSGYHRGCRAPELTPPARLIAVADAYQCAVESRPHDAAMEAGDAADLLRKGARAGTLDPDAVGAVLAAAGHTVGHVEHVAGLTPREEQTLTLLARGLATKQIGQELGVTSKTADHYVQQVYAKIGVSTRAAAAVYAMRHGIAI